MAAADRVVDPSFRTIDELAVQCGHYCWLEEALFAVAGDRASRPDVDGAEPALPEVRLALSELSARHALWADQWRDRLPVRAGVDAEALVTAPPGPLAAAAALVAAELDPLVVLGGVTRHILPRLLDLYTAHLAAASPVSEAPVRALLGWVIGATWSERRAADDLLDRVAHGGRAAENLADFGSALARALEGAQDVSPAARAS